LAKSLFDDRPKFNSKRVIICLTSHIVEFDISTESRERSFRVTEAEMDLSAAAGIAIRTVDKFCGAQVLADFHMRPQTIGRFESLVDFVGTKFFLGQGPTAFSTVLEWSSKVSL